MLQRLWSVLQWKEANSEEFGMKAVSLLVTELLLYSTTANRREWTAENIDKLVQSSIEKWSFPKKVKPGDRLGEHGPVVSGKVSVINLSTKLVEGVYPFPRSFKKAIAMSNRGHIADDIANGIKGLRLRYFPNVRFRDSSYHMCVNWDEQQVLMVVGATDPGEENVALAESLSEDVIQNLHMTGILYRSRVDNLLGHVSILPWMEKVGILQSRRRCDFTFEPVSINFVKYFQW